jgi:hypothetical protein
MGLSKLHLFHNDTIEAHESVNEVITRMTVPWVNKLYTNFTA